MTAGFFVRGMQCRDSSAGMRFPNRARSDLGSDCSYHSRVGAGHQEFSPFCRYSWLTFSSLWIQIFPMLETTLAQLERVVADLLQRNQTLIQNCNQLEQELRQAREENDNLQLAALEQEERQATMLARLQALIERAGASSVA